jgi:hypothetical protein
VRTGLASERVPLDGVEAKLSIAIHAPKAQSANAAKIRGLKNADSEAERSFFIGAVVKS